SQGAGARVEAAEGARNSTVAVRDAGEIQRARALGAPRSHRTGEVHRVDRRWKAAPSGVPRTARRQSGKGRGHGRSGSTDRSDDIARTTDEKEGRQAEQRRTRAGDRTAPDAGGCAQGRRRRASERRPRPRDEPVEDLLATPRDHERRAAPLLRRGLALPPPRRRGSAAGDEALTERDHGPGVLSAAFARRAT